LWILLLIKKVTVVLRYRLCRDTQKAQGVAKLAVHRWSPRVLIRTFHKQEKRLRLYIYNSEIYFMNPAE
jgi:hypothetical protein